MMAEFITENSFRLPLDELLSLRITEMHEMTVYSTEELYNWCR